MKAKDEKAEEAREEEETAEAEEAKEEKVEEEIIEEAVEKAEEAAKEVEEAKEEKEVKKAEKEEEIVEERVYTIPLGRAWISPRKRRAPRAIRLIKSFVQRHMKPEELVLSDELNAKVWSRGIEKPPRKIRVRAVKDKEGTVTLHLAEGD